MTHKEMHQATEALSHWFQSQSVSPNNAIAIMCLLISLIAETDHTGECQSTALSACGIIKDYLANRQAH